MKARFAALLVAASCLVAIPAAAANPNPALQEARELTSRATVEYDVGHFDQALELYTRAYERYPKPALLFDIGQCHRQLGHYERAIFFYQGYLRGQPEAPNRPLVEKFLADSQQQLDAQRAAAANSPPPTTAAPSAEQGAISPTQASTDASPSPDATAPADATTPKKGMSVMEIAGLAMAGTGVVLLIVGIVEGLQASSLQNQVSNVSSQHGTWSAQDQSSYNSGKSAATTANVLYVTGAVLLAGGGVLTWLGWPKASSTAAAVAPLPGGASVSLVSSF
jgi:tetratricopeptide (TPR) repeat protein